jgi:hypothetical protein
MIARRRSLIAAAGTGPFLFISEAMHSQALNLSRRKCAERGSISINFISVIDFY